MATLKEYSDSSKLVRELGVYCVKYGITKADLAPIASKKIELEHKKRERDKEQEGDIDKW